MAASTPLSYSEDPTLFLYTSLTAGSSHIITATSRLETILKANKIPFRAVDIATDEKARMIWGRRSKGRKLPGLVKFANVIGALDEIEEWNEYGELKEQIGATPTAEITSSKAATVPPNVSEPPSRSSSESRHISISEPKETRDVGPTNATKTTDTPLTMAMRQAGAEAAAKAGQKKTMKPMPSVAQEAKEAETTAPIVAPQLGLSDAEPATEVTAAKTPAQLASEGVKRTSVDKIADTKSSPDEGLIPDTPPSNEAQVLDLRRSSSITKAPSRLSKTQNIEEQSPPGESTTEFPGKLETPKFSSPPVDRPPTHHRGSSLSQGSREEIAAMEEANKIPEEEEPDEEAVEEDVPSSNKVEASDEAETAITSGEKTQEQDAKDGEAAGKSVGD